MRRRSILPLFLFCLPVAADSAEDLRFARRLGELGYAEMGKQVLEEMIAKGDADTKRAGRYGLALLTKLEATRAKGLFLFDLGESRPPRLTREQVVAMYEQALPDIEGYVAGAKEDVEAKFLLAEMKAEFAEFLTGAGYPDSMAAEREKLLEENRKRAEELFGQGIALYGEVAEKSRAALPAEFEPSHPTYVRLVEAGYQGALLQFRLALIFPSGVNFTNRIDRAIEALDEFAARHYEEIYGWYAQLYLGRCFLERGMRGGDADQFEISMNYFDTLVSDLEDWDANTGALIAEAAYHCAVAANTLAGGGGKLKKAQPVFYENTIRVVGDMDRKLKERKNHPSALRARLEAAAAHAARNDFERAVTLAGEVLAAARLEGQGDIARDVTGRLTTWVANVTGNAVLSPALLFQIGESLANQDRAAHAITFFEKTVLASQTDDAKERFGYPARLRIAMAYRRDQRPYAAAETAMRVVNDFLASKQEEESALGLTAAEACNQARLALKDIAAATGRAEDRQRYEKVLEIFRTSFRGHRENADAAYTQARDLWNEKRYVEAAERYAEIVPTSPNYWRAQTKVPDCWRMQANADPDNAAAHWQRCLDSAKALVAESSTKPEDAGAKSARQHGQLYEALALAQLGRWKEALAASKSYLQSYPDHGFLLKGQILDVKLHAELATEDPAAAEATLAQLEQQQPDSPFLRGARRDVYDALVKRMEAEEAGQTRRRLAARAADLWAKETEFYTGDSASGALFRLGELRREAGDWARAAEAYEAAADNETDDARKRAFTLRAADMKLRALEGGGATASERTETLNQTRKLFTDALIDSAKQEQVLKALADPRNYPSREDFAAVRRDPETLVTAARVYRESSPPIPGLDGRWIAIRLVNHLHAFTNATVADNPFATAWWDGAELMLQCYKEIAEAGQGDVSRLAAEAGHAFSQKLLLQYTKMDGPERVQRVQTLHQALQRLAGK